MTKLQGNHILLQSITTSQFLGFFFWFYIYDKDTFMITVLQYFLPPTHPPSIKRRLSWNCKVKSGTMLSLQLLICDNQDDPYMVQSNQNRAITHIIYSCVFKPLISIFNISKTTKLFSFTYIKQGKALHVNWDSPIIYFKKSFC